jgi:fatty-acyl-CoA synthase
VLIHQESFAPLVKEIGPGLDTAVQLGDEFDAWLAAAAHDPPVEAPPLEDVVAIVGTGGTTGRPKGVMRPDLPRSTVGKVLKTEIRRELLG